MEIPTDYSSLVPYRFYSFTQKNNKRLAICRGYGKIVIFRALYCFFTYWYKWWICLCGEISASLHSFCCVVWKGLFIQKRCFLFYLNTLRPRQNGRHSADYTFNRIFVNENVRISIKFSLKCVPKCLINNIPALVQIMAWRRSGDKPLSEPMMVSLMTHICVTRPQWVKH